MFYSFLKIIIIIFLFGLCFNSIFSMQQEGDEIFQKCFKSENISKPNVQLFIGVCYLYGYHGVKENLGKAFKIFTDLRKVSNPMPLAGYYLGCCYLDKEKYKEAFELFEEAVNKTCFMAEAELACCYLYGSGVRQDINKALAILNESIFRKNSKEETIRNNVNLSQYYLGEYYEEFEGNLDKALDWYKKSAEQGNEDAKEKIHNLMIALEKEKLFEEFD